MPTKSPTLCKTVKKFQAKWNKNKFVCVGLDSEYKSLPQSVLKQSISSSIYSFNKKIIDLTYDLAACYKPNPAFYESEFTEGLKALQKTVSYIRTKDKNMPVIIDAKRGDIGNTNRGYAKYVFDELDADAATFQPYQGGSILRDGERTLETMLPFLDRRDKLTFILCRTSNPDSGEIQDLPISLKDISLSYKKKFGDLSKLRNILKMDVIPLYMVIAYMASKNWNQNGNVGLVIGATYPDEMIMIRKIVPEMPLLVPGAGAQGGDLKSTIQNGITKSGGLVVNASRSIIFASKKGDFAEAARREASNLSEEIKSYTKAF